MLRLLDLLSGRILLGKKRPQSHRPPCSPEPPKDPPPVRPGEPWCDTGPELRIRKRRKGK